MAVDLGENNLATTSNGTIYGGGQLRHIFRRESLTSLIDIRNVGRGQFYDHKGKGKIELLHGAFVRRAEQSEMKTVVFKDIVTPIECFFLMDDKIIDLFRNS